jgi:HEAT repeat protein
MRRAWVVLFIVTSVGLLTLTQCNRWLHPRPQPSPATTETVTSWMRCQECTSDERAQVVALGDTAVPLLRSFLLDGPPAADVDRYWRYLQPLAHPTNGSRPATQATLEHIREDYISNYRIRSAHALGEIRTADALSAVCEAKRRNFARPGVQKAINEALVQIPGSCPP